MQRLITLLAIVTIVALAPGVLQARSKDKQALRRCHAQFPEGVIAGKLPVLASYFGFPRSAVGSVYVNSPGNMMLKYTRSSVFSAMTAKLDSVFPGLQTRGNKGTRKWRPAGCQIMLIPARRGIIFKIFVP